jgi:hypothetical protein
MTEICVKIDRDTHDRHIKAELEAYLEKRKSGGAGIDTDIETHYKGMKQMGQWLLTIYEQEAAKRAKFFQSQNHRRFIEAFFDFVKRRAKDLGYRYEDVILMDTAITNDGYILLRVIPRPGAQKIGVETNG